MRPNPKLVSALVAGLIATSIVTLLAFVGPVLGPSPIDLVSILASLVLGLAGQPFILALTVHLIAGSVIFPVLYVFLAYPFLAGPPWLRGLTWGVALWMLVQLVLLPMAGVGVFSFRAPRPLLTAGSSLLTHVLYGLILGAVARPSLARAVEEESETQSDRHVA
jgi:uncharacterized membrane protein YagU involved in acid resistance